MIVDGTTSSNLEFSVVTKIRRRVRMEKPVGQTKEDWVVVQDEMEGPQRLLTEI